MFWVKSGTWWVYISELVRPRCYDQPESLTQGYNPPLPPMIRFDGIQHGPHRGREGLFENPGYYCFKGDPSIFRFIASRGGGD